MVLTDGNVEAVDDAEAAVLEPVGEDLRVSVEGTCWGKDGWREAYLGCARLNQGAAKAHEDAAADDEAKRLRVGARGRHDGAEEDDNGARQRAPGGVSQGFKFS